MRHKYNNLLQLDTGVQKQSLVVRNLLTSLIANGQMVTTPKRAKVIISVANKFFNKLVRLMTTREELDGKRLCIAEVKTTLFTEDTGKKVINELLPRFLDTKATSFLTSYKLGMRKGDASEEILIKII
jgi:ribosomal protein L17